jgi:hypothetical protein
MAVAAVFALGSLRAAERPAPRDAWSAQVIARLLATTPAEQDFIEVGDMVLRRSFLTAVRESLISGRAPNSTFDGAVTLWPGGNVYYTFDASVSAIHQRAFLDAAAEWAAFANLTFTARTTQPNYILVLDVPGLNGGTSHVGMTTPAQPLRIGSTSWNRGTLCHEIGHALGLVHEHQRSDRGSFVNILTANILAGQEGNFVLLSNSNNRGAYDFLSVMHYARNTFSVDPATKNTIEPLPANAAFLNLMGDSYPRVLSTSDRAGMAELYGPPATAPGSVVKNTRDSGPGSLRAAICYAFDHPGTTISFEIPTSDPGFSGGVFTIRLTDYLTGPDNNTTIDATTQTAFTGDTNPNGLEIVLTGQNTPATDQLFDGIIFTGTGCVVKGLAINRFAYSGVNLRRGASGNSVRGCYIGTEASGLAAAPNGFSGVAMDEASHHNTIGGANPGDGNVISGNGDRGVIIVNAGANVVAGNFIGLARGGAAALPNQAEGIAIFSGASGNIIGGSTAGARNIVSGNIRQGIVVGQTGTDGTIIQGNYVGTNSAGTLARPNGFAGITIFGGAKNSQVQGNLLSGNRNQGLTLSEAGTNGNVVSGNLIGTNADGTASIPNIFSGISIFGGAQNNVIGPGNVISGNINQGITISGAATNANTVAGNFIGTNPAGTAALANGGAGISIFLAAQGNIVGPGNLMSGNGNQGIAISGAGTNGNLVNGNFIGTNAAGTAAVGNAFAAVALFDGAQNNIIGGTAPGAGNVLSGNANQGVLIADAGTNGNRIEGNLIGVNAAGNAAVPNLFSGMDIFGGATGNIIGGGVGARNIISGNADYGIAISGSGTNANIVRGNTIGQNLTATAAVPNGLSGIALFGGAQGNQIGGSGAGDSNLIAGNGNDGVSTFDAATKFNSTLGNSIHGNGGGGIGRFTNSNDNQPTPAISAATLATSGGNGVTQINGTLSGAASNATFRVEFFGDTSASGEARTFLGAADVATNGSGDATIAFTSAVCLPTGQVVTSTATNAAGSTSALSATRAVTTMDGDGDGLPDAFESANGLNPGSDTDALLDRDGDGLSNLAEFRAGTDIANPASRFSLRVAPLTGNGLAIDLTTIAGKTYRVEKRFDFGTANQWLPFVDQITAPGATLRITDPHARDRNASFYRASVLP